MPKTFTNRLLPESKPARGASRSRLTESSRSRSEGLKFPRIFSQKQLAPFEEVEWEQRTAEITDDAGRAIFKQEQVEVPKGWSALATKIAVSKYFYGDPAKGSDPAAGGRESSVKQLVHRVTRTITDWGFRDGY